MIRLPAALLALALLGACRQVAGVDDRDPPSDAGSEAPRGFAVLPAACETCAEASCGSEIVACSEDPDCTRATDCVTDLSPPKAAVCGALALDSAAYASLGVCFRAACLSECAPDLKWSCAGSYSWPAPEQESATIQTTFVRYLDQKPLPGLLVRACDRRDVGCAEPLDADWTAADGNVTLVVPTPNKAAFGFGANGFDGYLEVEGPGVMPDLRFWGWPLIADAAAVAALPSLTEVAQLADSLGLNVEPSRGLIVVEPRDCFWGRASGVRLELAPAGPRPYYFDQGLPRIDLTETTEDGTGGFINVPPGSVTVSAFVGDSEGPFATSTFFVRAGAISQVSLVP